ncbi:MAG: zinc finger MYND domain-containing protein [Bacteroidota bacterium]
MPSIYKNILFPFIIPLTAHLGVAATLQNDVPVTPSTLQQVYWHIQNEDMPYIGEILFQKGKKLLQKRNLPEALSNFHCSARAYAEKLDKDEKSAYINFVVQSEQSCQTLVQSIVQYLVNVMNLYFKLAEKFLCIKDHGMTLRISKKTIELFEEGKKLIGKGAPFLFLLDVLACQGFHIQGKVYFIIRECDTSIVKFHKALVHAKNVQPLKEETLGNYLVNFDYIVGEAHHHLAMLLELKYREKSTRDIYDHCRKAKKRLKKYWRKYRNTNYLHLPQCQMMLLDATKNMLVYNLVPQKTEQYVIEVCKWYKRCLTLDFDKKTIQSLHMKLAKHYIRFASYLQKRWQLDIQAYIKKYPQKHLKEFLKLKGCRTCQKSSTDTKLRKCKRCQMSWYCSKKCQKIDWKTNHHSQPHREKCNQLKAINDPEAIVTLLIAQNEFT